MQFTYRCFCCNKVFESLNYLKQHQKHEVAISAPYKCCECRKEFDKKWSLSNHLARSRCGKVLHPDEQVYKVSRDGIVYSEPVNIPTDVDTANYTEDLQFENNENTENENLERNDIGLKEKCEIFIKSATDTALSLLCSMVGHENLNRKLAFDIFQSAVKLLVKPLLNFLKDEIIPIQENIESKVIFEQLALDYGNLFNEFTTEFRLQKQLTDVYDLYRDPVEDTITEVNKIVQKNNIPVIKSVVHKICLPDLIFNIKLFLELPNVLKEILEYQKKVYDSHELINIINGTIWQKVKQKFADNQIVIPVLQFNDDFVIDHHLSHRSQKTSIGGFYLIFPTLPPQFRSKLENILIAAIIKTVDLKEHGYLTCLNGLVDMFLAMETNGIDVSIDGEIHKVYIVLTQITGDNKGLNQVLGYVGSFNAFHYCRLCIGHRDDLRKQTREKIEELRTEDMYKNHIENIDPSNTGIKEKCAFSRLPSFEVFNNAVVDLQHDLFEGVCKTVLTKVLLHFIEEGTLRLSEFNKMRESFFAEPDKKNFNDVPLTMNQLRDRDIPMTSSEIKSFTLHLPLMLDHVVQDKTDKFWCLLLLLIEKIEIMLLPKFDDEILDHLTNVIEKHHKLFIELIGALFPKLHFELHYATAIRRLGPPVNYMAMRGESKHQWLKHVASSTASRKNPSKTLCIKDCYSIAARVLKKDGLRSDVLCGRERDINTEINNILVKVLPLNYIKDNTLKTIDSLKYNGITYKNNLVIHRMTSTSYELLDIISIVKNIENNDIFFICCQKYDYNYDRNIRAYKKISEKHVKTFIKLYPHDIDYEPVIRISLPSGDEVVKVLRKFEKI